MPNFMQIERTDFLPQLSTLFLVKISIFGAKKGFFAPVASAFKLTVFISCTQLKQSVSLLSVWFVFFYVHFSIVSKLGSNAGL